MSVMKSRRLTQLPHRRAFAWSKERRVRVPWRFSCILRTQTSSAAEPASRQASHHGECAPGINAGLPGGIGRACAIAHQPSGYGSLAICKAGWKPVAHRQCRDALGMTIEEGITENEKSVRLLLFEAVKSLVDLVAGGGVNESNRRGERLSRFLCFLHLELRIRVFRVHERGKTPRIGSEFVQQTQALGGQQIAEEGRPGDVAAWSAEAGNQSVSGRIAADGKDDRD